MVMDSMGVGEEPDADKYGDVGANTFLHAAENTDNFLIPNLQKLGLGNIDGAGDGRFMLSNEKVIGSFGKMREMSKGKDTITGHWEIAGIETLTPFKTYPDGFPKDFIEEFQKEIGTECIGNYPASGTEIIEVLGDEHEATGKPIVYTSSDSVFQIAANTDVIPLDRLYEICKIARKLLVGDWACGRVIARPYIKENGKRVRTTDRRDYAVSPTDKTLLDKVNEAGQTVYAIGKISDIFNAHGVSESVHTVGNMKLSDEAGIPVKIRACDTMGYGVPYTEVALPRSVPGIIYGLQHYAGVPSEMLEWHGHNDFYKAVSNAASAWLYGACAVNCSLLGIGERTGNIPLEAMVRA